MTKTWAVKLSQTKTVTLRIRAESAHEAVEEALDRGGWGTIDESEWDYGDLEATVVEGE